MRWDGTALRVICPSGAGHEEQKELLLGKSLTLLVCLFVCLSFELHRASNFLCPLLFC